MFSTMYKSVKLPMSSLKFSLNKALEQQQVKQQILDEQAENELTVKVKEWFEEANQTEAEAKVALATCAKTKAFMEARKAQAKTED